MAASGDAALRAGALARLARVRRKLHEPDGALSAYRRLAQIENDVTVDGIPAALVARAGSASVFQNTSRTAELRAEAAARRGRDTS